MIEPTVGRIVWYHPTHQDPGPHPDDQPLAALVAHVWNDRMVNLAVFTADGVPFSRTSVRLAQDDDALERGMCQWMPFQVGQAEKHSEDAARRLDELFAWAADNGFGKPPYLGPHGPDEEKPADESDVIEREKESTAKEVDPSSE